MPKVTNQNQTLPKKAAPKASSNGAAGSILSQAIDISDLQEDFIKICLYGANRVGKTTLAVQFPKPLLLVGLEPNKTGGATSVKHVKGVKYLKMDGTTAAMQLASELHKENPFASVVVDSATSFQDLILKEILNLPEVPEMLEFGMVSEDQYRQRSEKCRECLRPFLNLDCHVVVTAKEKNHNFPKESRKPKIIQDVNAFELEPFFAADLGGATVGWLHDACDYIGRLYIDKEIIRKETVTKVNGKDVTTVQYHETGRTIRRLRTMYHPNYAAGFRSCNPEAVPLFINNPTYPLIKKVIDGEKIKEGTYQLEEVEA